MPKHININMYRDGVRFRTVTVSSEHPDLQDIVQAVKVKEIMECLNQSLSLESLRFKVREVETPEQTEVDLQDADALDVAKPIVAAGGKG